MTRKIPMAKMGTVGQISEVFDLGWSREDIVRMQKEDPELSAIYTVVECEL